MDKNFQNKTVIITGSSFGIGQGAARAFAEKGAKVVLASRNESANEALVDEIKSRGGEALFVATDISKTEDVKRMAETAVNTYGTIDIAINNAGIEGTPGVRTADYEEDI